MIVTVTCNPALDKTAELDKLSIGSLNRLQNIRSDAGGKGINVSKMLHKLGAKSLATGFLGGSSGIEIQRQLDAVGIAHDFVTVAAQTRTNLKVWVDDSGITELNEPGMQVTSAEEQRLSDKLCALANEETIFVLSGSLPANFPMHYYRDLSRKLHERSAKVFVDADGAVLAQALEEKPDLIKPNRAELMAYFALEQVPNREGLLMLCRRLIEQGSGFVALSLGAEGALFVNQERAVWAEGLPVEVQSTVGAGDSMLAGLTFAFEQNLPLDEGLQLALACSAAAVTTEGTKAPELTLVKALQGQVRLHELR